MAPVREFHSWLLPVMLLGPDDFAKVASAASGFPSPMYNSVNYLQVDGMVSLFARTHDEQQIMRRASGPRKTTTYTKPPSQGESSPLMYRPQLAAYSHIAAGDTAKLYFSVQSDIDGNNLAQPLRTIKECVLFSICFAIPEKYENSFQTCANASAIPLGLRALKDLLKRMYSVAKEVNPDESAYDSLHILLDWIKENDDVERLLMQCGASQGFAEWKQRLPQKQVAGNFPDLFTAEFDNPLFKQQPDERYFTCLAGRLHRDPSPDAVNFQRPVLQLYEKSYNSDYEYSAPGSEPSAPDTLGIHGIKVFFDPESWRQRTN